MKNSFKSIKIGDVFGRLTVAGLPHRVGMTKVYKILCKCECGNLKEVQPSHLLAKTTKSCGCLNIETLIKTSKTHGLSQTSEYRIWQNILRRCLQKDYVVYEQYGARGIIVCDRWMSFDNFFEDMGLRPTKKHSIERVDNNKGYSPDNCKWATTTEQADNKRNTVYVEYLGERMTLTTMCRNLSLKRELIRKRLVAGWSLSDAIGLASSNKNRVKKRT